MASWDSFLSNFYFTRRGKLRILDSFGYGNKSRKLFNFEMERNCPFEAKRKEYEFGDAKRYEYGARRFTSITHKRYQDGDYADIDTSIADVRGVLYVPPMKLSQFDLSHFKIDEISFGTVSDVDLLYHRVIGDDCRDADVQIIKDGLDGKFEHFYTTCGSPIGGYENYDDDGEGGFYNVHYSTEYLDDQVFSICRADRLDIENFDFDNMQKFMLYYYRNIMSRYPRYLAKKFLPVDGNFPFVIRISGTKKKVPWAISDKAFQWQIVESVQPTRSQLYDEYRYLCLSWSDEMYGVKFYLTNDLDFAPYLISLTRIVPGDHEFIAGVPAIDQFWDGSGL